MNVISFPIQSHLNNVKANLNVIRQFNFFFLLLFFNSSISNAIEHSNYNIIIIIFFFFSISLFHLIVFISVRLTETKVHPVHLKCNPNWVNCSERFGLANQFIYNSIHSPLQRGCVWNEWSVSGKFCACRTFLETIFQLIICFVVNLRVADGSSVQFLLTKWLPQNYYFLSHRN